MGNIRFGLVRLGLFCFDCVWLGEGRLGWVWVDCLGLGEMSLV
jgi:hypothetical protein